MKVNEVDEKNLQDYVERLESCEEEKKQLTSLLSEIYDEAKSSGFDVKVLKKIVKLRREDPKERAYHESLLEVYKDALGMK